MLVSLTLGLDYTLFLRWDCSPPYDAEEDRA
jgi:hypothetical protein